MAAARARPSVVVKLGGSLMAGADLDALVDAALAAPARVTIVPGGGGFADAVRDAQARLGFSEGLAHRLALDAMGHFAEVLAERRPALAVTRDAGEIAAAHARGRVALWRPDRLRTGDAAVEESWRVTSDSLALFVATLIGADAVVLVKSAEPPRGRMGRNPPDGPDTADAGDRLRRGNAASGDARRLVAAGYVDAAFPDFLARTSAIVRLVGPADHGRLGAALADPDAAVGLVVASDATTDQEETQAWRRTS